MRRNISVFCSMMLILFLGIILGQLGGVDSMNAFRRGVNTIRASNMLKSAGGKPFSTGRGGVKPGVRGKPPYKPGHNPSRGPKYPIVRVPKRAPTATLKPPLKPPTFEFGKFMLVPEVPLATRLHGPIGVDSFILIFNPIVGRRLRQTVARVVTETGKKGIKIVSATIALGASVSLIKAFENRRIVETFPSPVTEDELVDTRAVDDVLNRWADRIIEMSREKGDEDLSEDELVEVFVEAFGYGGVYYFSHIDCDFKHPTLEHRYDETVMGMNQHDVEMAASAMPQSMKEIHAMAYQIQKVFYDAFQNLRRKMHAKNVEEFGNFFAPLAEVLEETAVDICITQHHQLRDLKEGYELGEKLERKIHKAVADAMKRDWKEFAVDVGGTGGVISILYKFISHDIRKIVSESYDDALLVFDTLRSSLNVKRLAFDLNDVRTQAAEAISLYETVRSSKSSDDEALESDVKDVFSDLADATTHLRSVLATFPHSRRLQGTAKKVMSRSKVGLKAFTSTFKFVHGHVHMRRLDEGIQFVLEVPSDPSSKASSTSSTEVDITDLVLAVLNACRSHGSHENIGEDVKQLMVAMHGVMRQVLEHIPMKHRKQWQSELLVDAVHDGGEELARHARNMVFGYEAAPVDFDYGYDAVVSIDSSTEDVRTDGHEDVRADGHEDEEPRSGK